MANLIRYTKPSQFDDLLKSLLVPNSICHVSEEERRQMIATNAYFRAQCRDFCPGEEENDWLAAEAEIDAMLGKSQ